MEKVHRPRIRAIVMISNYHGVRKAIDSQHFTVPNAMLRASQVATELGVWVAVLTHSRVYYIKPLKRVPACGYDRYGSQITRENYHGGPLGIKVRFTVPNIKPQYYVP